MPPPAGRVGARPYHDHCGPLEPLLSSCPEHLSLMFKRRCAQLLLFCCLPLRIDNVTTHKIGPLLSSPVSLSFSSVRSVRSVRSVVQPSSLPCSLRRSFLLCVSAFNRPSSRYLSLVSMHSMVQPRPLLRRVTIAAMYEMLQCDFGDLLGRGSRGGHIVGTA